MLSRSIASRLCTPPSLLFISAKSRLCSQCLHRRRCFSSVRDSLGAKPTAKLALRKPQYYFLSNSFLRRDRSSSISVCENGDPIPADLPPHRRRRKPESAGAAAYIIHPDASSLLSTSSAASKSRLRRECLAYLSLSKPRLTALIVLTTMSAYAIFPVDPLLSSPAAPTLSALTLLYLTAGTTLCSSSANALNMAFEPTLTGRCRVPAIALWSGDCFP
jgi:protoheme IX farnesyltransferase